MAKVQESIEPAISETESIILEYKERIRQALEMDSTKLKEKAEEDANYLITAAKREAEEIHRKSLAEAAEARQELARLINETHEKASHIMAEVVERSTTQAQSELTRISTEARNKISRVLTQISKNLEQIVGETETQLKLQLDCLSGTVAELDTKLQPLTEILAKGPGSKKPPAPAEETMPPSPAGRETPASISMASEKRAAPSKESDDSRLFEGSLRLEMVPPFNQERLEGVPQWLGRIAGMRVTSTGSYAGANKWITTYTADLDRPMPLLKILGSVPSVKDVSESKGIIVITLK